MVWQLMGFFGTPYRRPGLGNNLIVGVLFSNASAHVGIEIDLFFGSESRKIATAFEASTLRDMLELSFRYDSYITWQWLDSGAIMAQ